MKLDLYDHEVDTIVKLLYEEKWIVANPIIQKILSQANNPDMQGPACGQNTTLPEPASGGG